MATKQQLAEVIDRLIWCSIGVDKTYKHDGEDIDVFGDDKKCVKAEFLGLILTLAEKVEVTK